MNDPMMEARLYSNYYSDNNSNSRPFKTGERISERKRENSSGGIIRRIADAGTVRW